MKPVCLFCLQDPLGGGSHEPAFAATVENGYPLCLDHASHHGGKTFHEFSEFIEEAVDSGYVESGVACPVCGTEFGVGRGRTDPCAECDWQAPYPTAEWRAAWIAGLRKRAQHRKPEKVYEGSANDLADGFDYLWRALAHF